MVIVQNNSFLRDVSDATEPLRGHGDENNMRWEETFYCNAFAFLEEYLGFAYKTITFSPQGIVLMQKH